MKIKIGNTIFKYFPATALARNSVLFLTSVNAGGLAVAMYKAAKDSKSKAWQDLATTWEKVGGKRGALLQAIKKGMAIEYRHHPNKHGEKSAVFNYDPYETIFTDEDPDNFEPVTTGTAAATGAPLIAKILAVLKKAGISTEEAKNALRSLSKKGFAELSKSKRNKVSKDSTGANVIEIAPPGNIPNMESKGINTTTALIVIGVVVVGIVLTSGKR